MTNNTDTKQRLDNIEKLQKNLQHWQDSRRSITIDKWKEDFRFDKNSLNIEESKRLLGLIQTEEVNYIRTNIHNYSLYTHGRKNINGKELDTTNLNTIKDFFKEQTQTLQISIAAAEKERQDLRRSDLLASDKWKNREETIKGTTPEEKLKNWKQQFLERMNKNAQETAKLAVDSANYQNFKELTTFINSTKEDKTYSDELYMLDQWKNALKQEYEKETDVTKETTILEMQTAVSKCYDDLTNEENAYKNTTKRAVIDAVIETEKYKQLKTDLIDHENKKINDFLKPGHVTFITYSDVSKTINKTNSQLSDWKNFLNDWGKTKEKEEIENVVKSLNNSKTTVENAYTEEFKFRTHAYHTGDLFGLNIKKWSKELNSPNITSSELRDIVNLDKKQAVVFDFESPLFTRNRRKMIKFLEQKEKEIPFLERSETTKWKKWKEEVVKNDFNLQDWKNNPNKTKDEKQNIETYKVLLTRELEYTDNNKHKTRLKKDIALLNDMNNFLDKKSPSIAKKVVNFIFPSKNKQKFQSWKINEESKFPQPQKTEDQKTTTQTTLDPTTLKAAQAITQGLPAIRAANGRPSQVKANAKQHRVNETETQQRT